MVSKQQKQMKKKKERERDSHKKVLALRSTLRAQAKEQRDEYRRDKRIAKLQREMDRLDASLPVNVKDLPDNVLDQLEHNVKILSTLEEEHKMEEQARQELNQQLENQGPKTLNEKLKFLRQNLFQPDEFGVGGSAEYRMSAAPRRWKEVSDVEVIKAPREVSDVEVIKAPVQESTENS